MHGITAYGAYIPRLRLQRPAILAANAWGNCALSAHGKGERSMCNWDEDSVTLDPPGYYGMVEFDEEQGGGRFMADFTDVDPALVDVGAPVEMVFRIKQFDERRGFRRYFWKAVPKTGG